MKKDSLLLFIIVLAVSLNAQTVLVKKWDQRYGGSNDDELWSFQQTVDGGFLLGGASRSPISGDKTQSDWDTTLNSDDYWVVKIDSIGNKQWDKRFGGLGEDLFSRSGQILDDGYILGGYSTSGMNGNKSQPSWGEGDYWIIKIDSQGNQLWDKRFGGVGDDFLSSIVYTSDGGYLAGGFSNSPVSGDKTQPNWAINNISDDYWVVKTDSLGIKQWDKRFGGVGEDGLRAMQRTTDGGYILGGSSGSDSSGDKTQPLWGPNALNYWIIKIDSVGNKKWDRAFGGTSEDELYSLQQTTDGGYILGGYSYSDSNSLGHKTATKTGYWIVKTDSIGNWQWDKAFDGAYSFYSVIQTSDQGYLLSGNSSQTFAGGDKTENNLGLDQTWIVKTDLLGNKQWDKTIFTPESHDGWAIQTKEGCYAVANTSGGLGGYKSQPAWDSSADYWIVVFCDTLISGVIETSKTAQILVYPNPFVGDIAIVLQKENLTAADFTITNMVGQIVYNKHEDGLSSTYTKMLDLSYLPNGVYLVEVVVDGEMSVKEVIKQ